MNRVWLVEDKIPIQTLYGGPFPSRLDKNMVSRLLELGDAEWEEKEVYELCRNLCNSGYDVAFFLSPQAMLTFLQETAWPPHSVIFDWEYPGSDGKSNSSVLEVLLEGSFAYLQVYTHLGEEGGQAELSALRTKFGNRVLQTRAKAEVNPDQLAEEIKQAWTGTIAGDLADRARKAVFGAVERSLIEMCGVPRGAIAAMTQGASENLVQVVVSKIRDEIGSEGFSVLNEIVGASHIGESSDGLRRLLSIWYYFFPDDDVVRRGDLVEVGEDLGFVVTPPCDITKFAKKTGTQLTWLRCVRLKQGANMLSQMGYQLNDMGSSIIASHGKAGHAIVVLPNVPESSGRNTVADYVLLCHAWESRAFEGVGGGVVHYGSLTGLQRRCTVAAEFANSIVTAVTAVIASTGMPDLPRGEVRRLAALLAAEEGGGAR